MECRAPGRRQQARQTWWATNRSARARPEPPTPSPPSPPPPSSTPPSPSRRHHRHSRHRRHLSHSRRRRPRPPLSPPPVLATTLPVSASSRPPSPSSLSRHRRHPCRRVAALADHHRRLAFGRSPPRRLGRRHRPQRLSPLATNLMHACAAHVYFRRGMMRPGGRHLAGSAQLGESYLRARACRDSLCVSVTSTYMLRNVTVSVISDDR